MLSATYFSSDAALGRNAGRVMNAVFHLVQALQVARAFMGRTADLLSLSDDEYDEDRRDLGSICATEYVNQIGCYLIRYHPPLV